MTSLEAKRRYQHSAKGKATAARYRQTPKGKAIAADQQRSDPRKTNARHAVYVAIQNGELVRPETCSCGGSPVEAHHALGYDREHWLDVEWLCDPCHKREDGLCLT